jgi:hypothetical protein
VWKKKKKGKKKKEKRKKEKRRKEWHVEQNDGKWKNESHGKVVVHVLETWVLWLVVPMKDLQTRRQIPVYT